MPAWENSDQPLPQLLDISPLTFLTPSLIWFPCVLCLVYSISLWLPIISCLPSDCFVISITNFQNLWSHGRNSTQTLDRLVGESADILFAAAGLLVNTNPDVARLLVAKMEAHYGFTGFTVFRRNLAKIPEKALKTAPKLTSTCSMSGGHAQQSRVSGLHRYQTAESLFPASVSEPMRLIFYNVRVSGSTSHNIF